MWSKVSGDGLLLLVGKIMVADPLMILHLAASPKSFLKSFLDMEQRAVWEPMYRGGAVVELIDVMKCANGYLSSSLATSASTSSFSSSSSEPSLGKCFIPAGPATIRIITNPALLLLLLLLLLLCRDDIGRDCGASLSGDEDSQPGRDFGESDEDSLDQMAVARFNDPGLQEVRTSSSSSSRRSYEGLKNTLILTTMNWMDEHR